MDFSLQNIDVKRFSGLNERNGGANTIAGDICSFDFVSDYIRGDIDELHAGCGVFSKNNGK